MARNTESSNSADTSWDGKAIDFELTDFADARRVLDVESLSQFEVATVESEAHWKRLRRQRLPGDRALTGVSIDWLLALPPSLRPDRLSRDFPRIVNDLASAWRAPLECHAALDRLLNSARRGRQGFPAAVLVELVALRDWLQPF